MLRVSELSSEDLLDPVAGVLMADWLVSDLRSSMIEAAACSFLIIISLNVRRVLDSTTTGFFQVSFCRNIDGPYCMNLWNR